LLFSWVCCLSIVMGLSPGLSKLCFSCIFVLLGIFLSIIGTCLSVKIFSVWSFLVVGTLSTTGWLKSQVHASSLATYFIISAIGRLIYLLSTIYNGPASLLTCLSILLLIGIFPFQFWIFKVISQLKPFSLFIFLGPMKFGYVYLLVSNLLNFARLLLGSAVVGLFVLYSSTNYNLFVYGSSATHTFLLSLMGTHLATSYFSIYVLSLLGVTLSQHTNLSTFIGFVILAGIPPFGMFWAKALALSSLPLFASLVLLIVATLSTWPYINFGLLTFTRQPSSILLASFFVWLPLLGFVFLCP